MAAKCVHRGCGKQFTDPRDPPCVYHPGPPVFHEGQKGWTCCKPRVLTFDEFMHIPPCTTGQHSTTDLPPEPEKVKLAAETAAPVAPASQLSRLSVRPQPWPAPAPPPPPSPETDDDDAALAIPDGKTCRRRACGAIYQAGRPRENETCAFHPGGPIFHEGSKGYLCCKRRVLEFDEFMHIDGCTTKSRHLFIGSGKKSAATAIAPGAEQSLETVRHDFYQSVSSVIASFFLKRVVKDQSTVGFGQQEIALDLVTSDSPPKRYRTKVPLFAVIDAARSTYAVLGTKVEVTLAKADPCPWPVLRSDEARTGEILQIGNASHG